MGGADTRESSVVSSSAADDMNGGGAASDKIATARGSDDSRSADVAEMADDYSETAAGEFR